MKTQVSLRSLFTLIISIAATTLITNVYARSAADSMNAKCVVKTINDGTTYISVAGGKDQKLNNINIKAVRDFMFRFKEINNTRWYKVKGGFVAKFTSGTITNMVTYKRNGEWLYTISSYGESNMPEAVKAIVKSDYQDFDIVHIKEIQVPDEDATVYLIYLQDAKTIKVLRVCDREMEVLHDYTRG